MSTNNDRWIKASERKATEDDLPVWVCDRGGRRHLFDGCLPGDVWEYWKPAAADIPAPPKEPTQDERDTDARRDWIDKTEVRFVTVGNAWHAALAYERAEVSKLLPPVRPLVSYGTGITAATDSVEAIRARCGGAK